MRTALAFIRRDFQIATSYKLAFAMQLCSVFAAVPLYYYISRLFDDKAAKVMDGDPFAFWLTGLAFASFVRLSLDTFQRSLRDSQLMGTLEIMLLSPTPLTAILVNSSLWAYLLATVRFGMFLLVGALFGVELGNCNLFAALLILVIAVAGFAGYGFLAAGLVVVFKRAFGLTPIMLLSSFAVGGVLFPADILPGWVSVLAEYHPTNHALKGIRLAILKGAPTADLIPHMTFLLIFAAIFITVGLICFRWGVRRTKITGTLAQY